ncbi:MAG: phosphate/phosphite/phosphonate ABC transporter substrate-binding protein [Steroidobacteraceae bacterium]
MGAERIAALPMYDFPQVRGAHDAFWAALAGRLTAAGLDDVPRELTRDLGHRDVWRHPSLLFAQGCEYPLAKSFADQVRLVAAPRYSAPGCEGANYHSAIVVRREEMGSLADLRGRRCVVNEMDSNSGMNLLRAAVAPLAGRACYFASVTVSGSHRRSAEIVAAGEADLAALDCVSFAHFRRLYPEVVAKLRVLSWTPSSPCLPFITARSTDDATVQLLRSALAGLFADDTLTAVREQLFLAGVDLQPVEGFGEVLGLERGAVEQGYPTLC